jgi:hypothetical protein
MLYVRYVHLTKATHIHKRHPSSRQRGYYVRTDSKGSLAKKKQSRRGSQGAWRQDELIGGKLLVVK